MESVSGYILRVVAAAFLLGILGSLTDQKGSTAALLRLMGGLFLTFTLLSPVLSLDFSAVRNYLADFAETGELTAVSGENMARAEYRTIIKEKLEAYILDKANELGLDLTVEVALGEDDTPREIIIAGTASPFGKGNLQQFIIDELGVAKENQLWIGQR